MEVGESLKYSLIPSVMMIIPRKIIHNDYKNKYLYECGRNEINNRSVNVIKNSKSYSYKNKIKGNTFKLRGKLIIKSQYYLNDKLSKVKI